MRLLKNSEIADLIEKGKNSEGVIESKYYPEPESMEMDVIGMIGYAVFGGNLRQLENEMLQRLDGYNYAKAYGEVLGIGMALVRVFVSCHNLTYFRADNFIKVLRENPEANQEETAEILDKAANDAWEAEYGSKYQTI